MRGFVGALILSLVTLGTATGQAQPQTVTVGAPAGMLVQLVQDLGRTFQAQTGIAVRAVATGKGAAAASDGVDALLRPSRMGPEGPEEEAVFFGEGVLVGSRADRARLRGLRDIKKAFRWIAGARAIYVSSSPSLGLRDVELKLWDDVGINVRVRSTWYIEVSGDEAAVFRQAAQWGA